MGCASLTIIGGVFEVAGFMLIAWELARIQRREFGNPRALVWVAQRVRAIGAFFRQPVQRDVTLRAGSSAGGSVNVRARARAAPGDSVEDRLAALDAELESIARCNTDAIHPTQSHPTAPETVL